MNSALKSVVILPTYNESENLPKIVPAILATLPQTHILVVDDNSPDGTGKIADDLSQQFPNQIFVLHRQAKEGLGRAYLAAFRHVLDLGYEQIIQMDADFSHPIEVLPHLLKGLESYDFVVGSRYISGGGVANWSLLRRLISRGGNLYAKIVLGQPIQDLTGGFKAFHRRVLKFLTNTPIQSVGYHFQIETTTRALNEGFSCGEIPFVFQERAQGHSKMSKSIFFEALWQTLQLRQTLKQQKKESAKAATTSLVPSNK